MEKSVFLQLFFLQSIILILAIFGRLKNRNIFQIADGSGPLHIRQHVNF